MADPELVRTLDYILNRCDDAAIDAVAAAVVRRRRNLALFGADRIPDPQKMARDLSARINIGASIEGLRETIRSMAVRMIRQEAPELTDEQIDELTAAWIPGAGSGGRSFPRDVLASMVEQFVSFSLGRMSPSEDQSLRNEIGAWPERYWKSFPKVIRLIITDYLNGALNEGEFNSKISAALAMG
ncbi:MAG: hypothetical protein LBO80_00535 [Treponema sp.]|jgi:hypothetical protein|nr:hypothetical protein [Treponema sp.]